MAKTVYSRGSGVHVKGGVGPVNAGHMNLLRHTKRGPKGRYQATDDAVPVYALNRRYWATIDRYRGKAMSGQLKVLMEEINLWTKHIKEEAHKVAHNALVPTFQKSQRYCPVSLDGSRPYDSPGTLKRSGRLVIKEKGSVGATSRSEVSISYGGNGIPFYAVFVHEIPRRHTPPTRYKFLEAALKEDMSDIKARMFDGVKTISGGG